MTTNPRQRMTCRIRTCLLALAAPLAFGLSACGGDASIDPPPPPTAPQPTGSAKVDVRGAVLESADGARVVIPPSASLYTYEATISRSSEGAPPLPAGLVPVGAVYALQPHGAVFTMPIRVSLPFDSAAVPAGASVRVARGDPGGRWDILPGTIEGNRVSVTSTGFSFYLPVVVYTATFVFPPTAPFGEVTMTGQAPINAQSPQAVFSDGTPNTSIPVLDYRVFTQAQLNTPLSLTLRGAVTAGSDIDQYCGSREVRLVVTAYSARVYPDPANSSRTLVRTNRQVREPGGFGYADPIELASLPMPRDGVVRTQNFSLNLAHYAYQLGVNDYPPDPWTGGPANFDPFWGGPDPLPLSGAAGLSLSTHFSCSEQLWFDNYDRSPYTALRRGFADTLAFTATPTDLRVVEGEPAAFSVRLAQPGNPVPGQPERVIESWQRTLSGFPDQWIDIDVFANNLAASDGWGASFSEQYTRLIRETTTRSQHNGTRYRAVICEYTGNFPNATRGACLTSPAATLTVTQDFVAPQLLTSPVPQITVRENAAGQVTQFTATFSGVPRPTVRWETKAPGSPQWDPVDPATHTLNGNTLSTTRAFTLADRGREYRAVAFNGGGSTTSFSSTLFVTTGLEAPALTTQPQDASVVAGSPVLFAASVTGSSPLSYQWYFNGTPLAGANGSVLALNNVNGGNAGTYEIEVSNRENRVRSRAARLTVAVAQATPPRVAAPKILTQPAGVTVTAGNTATFAVGAQGTAPLSYQWYRNDRLIEGATASALTIAEVSEADAGIYAVAVSNDGGKLRSDSVPLTVRPAASGPPQPVAPAIATQPTGLVVNVGQTATLAVAASGSGPLAFQWRRNGVPIAGANGPILTIGAVSIGDAGQYSVVISNSAGQATSADAGLVVTPVPGTPVISASPANLSALVGQAATFAAAVTGNPAPQCQWTRNGLAIGGAVNCASYTTPTLTLADNGAIYNLIAYNAAGAVFGSGAVLSVQPLLAPTITAQPQSLTVTEGQAASFSVAATSNGALTFQWRRGGVDVSGATDNVYPLGVAGIGDNGAQFSVRVCTGPQADNLCTVSGVATLAVDVAVPANALTATQIVAGQEWSMVLRPDRTVWAWGRMHRNDGTVQSLNLLVVNQALRPVRMYPAVLTDVRAISGWASGYWALKGEPGSTGSRVLHWGRAFAGSDGRGGDGNGSLGSSIPPRDNEAAPVEVLERVNNVPQPVDRVCAIAGGGEQLAMIRAINSAGTSTDCNPGSAKTVWFVGSLLGRGYESTGVTFAMPGLPVDSPPAAIFTGQTTSGSPGLAIALEDGRVYGLGANPYGGYGVPSMGGGPVGGLGGPLLLPATWGNARSFGMSFYYSLFVVRADGSVMTSGYDGFGELGLGSVIGGSTLGPVAVRAETCASLPCADTLTGVTALASGNGAATLALKNGQILGWGSRGSGLLGPVASGGQPFPRPVASPGVSGFTALSASNLHALVIGPGNVVYAWGSGLRGALGDGVDGNTRTAPGMVTTGP
jgi:hypothetical protein